MQMQNGGGMGRGLGRGHAQGGHDPQQAALNEAMMEQLQRQDREERLDAHIQRRSRETAEAVLRGKTPAEAAASPAPAVAPTPAGALYPPIIHPGGLQQVHPGGLQQVHPGGFQQVGFTFRHQTPLEQRIRENAPYHQTMF